jgi:hypothetical protein
LTTGAPPRISHGLSNQIVAVPVCDRRADRDKHRQHGGKRWQSGGASENYIHRVRAPAGMSGVSMTRLVPRSLYSDDSRRKIESGLRMTTVQDVPVCWSRLRSTGITNLVIPGERGNAARGKGT